MKNNQLKTQWPWFDLSMSSKVEFYKANWNIYDLLCVCNTNVDHMMYPLWYTTYSKLCELYLTFKGHLRPNWTFLMLKMTFGGFPHNGYFRIGLVSHLRRYLIQYIWAALHYYLIISIEKIGQTWPFLPWQWPSE